MKKILIVSCMLVSVAGMAQNTRQTPTVQQQTSPAPQQTPPANQSNETRIHPGKLNTKYVDKPPTSNKPNNNNNAGGNAANGNNGKAKARSSEEYKASLNGVVNSEFGRSRAEAAKAKEAPKSDEDANKRIDELRSNSKEGLDRAEEKIEIAKNRLEELKAAGEITDAEYASKMKEIKELEKRKDSLKSSVN